MLVRIDRRTAVKGYTNIVTVDASADGALLSEPVDLALFVDAFHHLPEDRVAYFADLAQVIRAGGRVAVIEALPRWFLFGHSTEPDRIRSVLSDAGYRQNADHEFLPRQSFVIFEPPHV